MTQQLRSPSVIVTSMSRPDTESGTTKRQRVLRACDSCRIKKAKCEGTLPCTSCVQRDVPCIRRSGSKDVSKPHELLNTLVQAVHALYQAGNNDLKTTRRRDTTTHAILESLGLIEQENVNSEVGYKYTRPEGTWTPTSSTNSSPCQFFTGSEESSRSKLMSPFPHQITGSGTGLPSSKSSNGTVNRQTVTAEAALNTPPSSQYLSTLTGDPGFCDFEPHDSISSLFGSEFQEETMLLNNAWTTDPTPAFSFPEGSTSAMVDDFPHHYKPVSQPRPPELDQSAQEAWGFDGPSRPQKHSLVEDEQVEMINHWTTFGQHAEHDDCESLTTSLQSSFCASTFPEAYPWRKDDLPATLKEFPSPITSASPKEVDVEPTSETHPNLARKKQKRGRKKKGSSSSGTPQTSENEKRRLSLESNRQAATKCREKKRREVDQLKEVAHDAAAQNSLLKQQATKMQDESKKLRFELLFHMSHRGCCKPEELRKVLDDSTDGKSLLGSHIEDDT